MLALLALMTAILVGVGLKVIEAGIDRKRYRDKVEPLRNVILPPELNQEDFDWFVWAMEMAGFEGGGWVVNTCSCGFAAECYMHCNHELNDGKCTGHAWKQMESARSGKFVATRDSVKEQKIAELASIRKAHREAKLTANNIRKEIDRAHVEMKRFRERADSLRAAQRRESYDPLTDLYTLENGRKISRLMYEDLAGHGRLEAVYEFGSAEPVTYFGTPL